MNKLTVARVLFAIPGLFILMSGLMFLFNPAGAADKLLLVPQGAEGLSNLRGMLGASVIAVGSSVLLGAVTAKLEYVRPGAIFVLVLIGARVLSYVVDGPNDSIVLFVAVPSTVFMLLVAGHKLLDSAHAEEAQTARA